WRVEVIAADGEVIGPTVSVTIPVESRPKISTYRIVLQNTTEEGVYSFWITTTDELNKTIEEVTARIIIVGLNNYTVIRIFDSAGAGTFILDFELLSILVPLGGDFASLLHTLLLIEVTLVADVLDSETDVLGRQSFSLTIADTVAPRVIEADYVWNLFNPTQITFWASIEESGAGVAEIVLYYYFQLVTAEGTKYQALAAYNQTVMTFNGTHYLATISVPQSTNLLRFTPEEYELSFTIQTSDQAGNVNDFAANVIKRSFSLPFNLFFLFLLVGIIIAIIGVVALVAIRRFSGTELVGLDINKVLEASQQVSQEEIRSNITGHTLGIVISTFDQLHGPIPLFVEPPILKDNFDKLIELSDRAFSAVRFVADFEREIFTVFEFDFGVLTTSISYGFSLDRPAARGGAENISLNIVIHKPFDALVTKFADAYANDVHQIHMLMNQGASEKEQIANIVVNIRKTITAIILAYEELYGSVEEFELD
ncbi:MAG: hypothetical protein ACFFC7_21275, partial [Candidatus Hermodarchaeota archaeon]